MTKVQKNVTTVRNTDGKNMILLTEIYRHNTKRKDTFAVTNWNIPLYPQNLKKLLKLLTKHIKEIKEAENKHKNRR